MASVLLEFMILQLVDLLCIEAKYILYIKVEYPLPGRPSLSANIYFFARLAKSPLL